MRIYVDNLLLQSSTLDEIDELNCIYNEACDYFRFDPMHNISSPLMCIQEGDLPPGGIKANFDIISCYMENTMIGYLTIYKGYPTEDTFYIGFIYLLNSDKHQKIGSKIVSFFCFYFKRQGFMKSRVSVSLKNWDALRFWHKCGYASVTTVNCSGPFSENNYGCIELEKDI